MKKFFSAPEMASTVCKRETCSAEHEKYAVRDVASCNCQTELFLFFFAVPSRPPNNITAHGTNSTSVVVKWSPISEIDVRGKLLGYLVQYREASTQESYNNISLQASASVAVIKGLKGFTLYRIQVAGFTSVGVGVQSRPQYAKTGTTCNEPYLNNWLSANIKIPGRLLITRPLLRFSVPWLLIQNRSRNVS